MTPIKCSYFMCNNTSKDYSLFRFPTGHASRLAVWLRNCGNMTITHLSNQVLRNRYLCIRHFDDRFIKNKTGKRKTLSKIAVPQNHKDEQISFMTSLSPCASTSQARATSPVLKVLKPTKVYKSQLTCNTENDNESSESGAPLCFDTPKKRKSTDTPKYTSEFPEPVASSVEVQTHQVPEPHQTSNIGLENPVSQPRPASRRRLRHRPSVNSNILLTRSDREWVKELERNRVRAENKMADATLMIAEAAKKIAEASLINAESNRMNAETNRKQLEVMKAIMDIVHQRAALATGVSETAVHQILKEKEGRNADKQQEPPEKRYRARKRSRQTHSSSEADSSDDNDGDNEQSSNYQDEEPEIEVGPGSMKIEPSDIEVNKEQAQTDPISLDVKTEPRNDEVDITNETLSLNEPAGTKRKARKIPRSDLTSTRSGLFGETEMKTEEIEIHEEGFS